jgi:hypothetical protein
MSVNDACRNRLLYRLRRRQLTSPLRSSRGVPSGYRRVSISVSRSHLAVGYRQELRIVPSPTVRASVRSDPGLAARPIRRRRILAAVRTARADAAFVSTLPRA